MAAAAAAEGGGASTTSRKRKRAAAAAATAPAAAADSRDAGESRHAWLPALAHDAVGSRALECVLLHCDAPLFAALFETQVGRLASRFRASALSDPSFSHMQLGGGSALPELAMHPIANFIVQVGL